MDNSVSPENSLISEAKKYKSAEEFVKAQGTPVYHGTNKEFDNFDLSKAGTIQKSDWGTGVYLEPNKNFASRYAEIATEKGGGSKIVKNVYISPSAKVYEHNFERTL